MGQTSFRDHKVARSGQDTEHALPDTVEKLCKTVAGSIRFLEILLEKTPCPRPKGRSGVIILMYIQAYVSHAAFASCFIELVPNAVLLKQYSTQDESTFFICCSFHNMVIL